MTVDVAFVKCVAAERGPAAHVDPPGQGSSYKGTHQLCLLVAWDPSLKTRPNNLRAETKGQGLKADINNCDASATADPGSYHPFGREMGVRRSERGGEVWA